MSLTQFENNSVLLLTVVKKSAGDGVASKRSTTYPILGLISEMMTYKPVFHAYSAFLQ